MKKESLLDQKFGRLLVIAEAQPVGPRRRTAWLCVCDCGEEKVIQSGELKNGDTKSCGCLNKEMNVERGRKMGESCTKYHPSETTARRVWRNRYGDGISFEDFFRISQMNCHYCGAKPSNIQNNAKDDKKSSQFAKDNGNFIYNGLDRINSDLPHAVGNCVPCCWICNRAKCAMTPEEFDIWIERIYQTLQKRKSR